MRHRTADTPKGHRNYVIIACDVLLFLAMLKWLPVEPEVARGLAVLTFTGMNGQRIRQALALGQMPGEFVHQLPLLI